MENLSESPVQYDELFLKQPAQAKGTTDSQTSNNKLSKIVAEQLGEAEVKMNFLPRRLGDSLTP